MRARSQLDAAPNGAGRILLGASYKDVAPPEPSPLRALSVDYRTVKSAGLLGGLHSSTQVSQGELLDLNRS
jgi:hypothetical protein